MNKSIMRRLEELSRHLPNPLIVLAKNVETGEIKEMPMLELVKKFHEWRMEKVVGGNDLNDLDEYLAAFRKYYKACDL